MKVINFITVVIISNFFNEFYFLKNTSWFWDCRKLISLIDDKKTIFYAF